MRIEKVIGDELFRLVESKPQQIICHVVGDDDGWFDITLVDETNGKHHLQISFQEMQILNNRLQHAMNLLDDAPHSMRMTHHRCIDVTEEHLGVINLRRLDT